MGATFIKSEYLENLEGGEPVGSKQCVALVVDLLQKQYPDKQRNELTHENWKRGTKVLSYGSGNMVKNGMPIATFNQLGIYPSCQSGNHAAIFLEFEGSGIKVLEQNVGPKISSRTIRNKKTNNGEFPKCSGMKDLKKDTPSNDADWYYVIEIDGL